MQLPCGLVPGAYVKTTNLPTDLVSPFNLGDSVVLYWLDKKSIFYNVWSFKIHKNIISRAAGTFCTYIDADEEKEFIRVKIPSGLIKLFYSLTFVTLGQNSNKIRKYFVTGKAGDNFKLGFRPKVRGVAMNPVDHPNGGRTKTNSPERTPWSKIAKQNK